MIQTTWRTLFLDLRTGFFIPRLVTWDPETGEFTCVEWPKGSRRGRKPMKPGASGFHRNVLETTGLMEIGGQRTAGGRRKRA
jgi:hypothetical protein